MGFKKKDSNCMSYYVGVVYDLFKLPIKFLYDLWIYTTIFWKLKQKTKYGGRNIFLQTYPNY